MGCVKVDFIIKILVDRISSAKMGVLQLLFVISLTRISLGSSFTPRIVDGVAARPEQFPYRVYISVKLNSTSEYTCEGALINHEWVLTAAHCADKGDEIYVKFGSLKPSEYHEEVPISAIIIHEDFNYEHFGNNVAMLKLACGVEFNEYIHRIRLPKNHDQLYLLSQAEVSGIGRIGKEELVWPTVISNEECSKFYFRFPILDSMICAQGNIKENHMESPCFGDSGAPLVIRSDPKVLIGIAIIKTHEKCEAGFPVVYTRITSHIHWIRDTIVNNP